MSACGQRGNAMLIAIFLLVTLTMLGMGVVATATTDLKVSDNYGRATQAMYAAEAGAQHAVALLTADRSIGSVAPNPSGTPLYTGSVAGSDYKIWMWGERYYEGAQRSAPFEVSGMRQVVVEASDGKRTKRRLSAIVEPNTPRALRRAIFSCGSVNLTSQDNDDVSGNIYASGDISYSSQIAGSIFGDAALNLTAGDVVGSVSASGNIVNTNASNVTGSCKSAGNIQRVNRCQTAYEYAADPVKELCNFAVTGWDPANFSLTPAEIADFYTATPTANRHPGGWFITASGEVTGKHHVTGNLYLTGVTLTYDAETGIVIENGSFLCSDCRVVPKDADARLSIVTAGAAGGSISFHATNPAASEINGVLWAGVVDGTALPAQGSVSVSGSARVRVNGSVVALAPTGTVSSTSSTGALEVFRTPEIPSLFVGANDGFSISEWREVKR